MSFYKSIQLNDTTTAYFWKITEQYNMLLRDVKLKDTSLVRLENMKSESHQKGFLAVRMLLQYIGYSDFNLFYDNLGKPHLKNKDNSTKYISISHSHEFSALVISCKNIGLDIEKLKEKTLKIAPRFMNVSHLENLNDEKKIKKATIVWGIKESIFKIKNEAGISFPNHIFENPFSIEDKKATAELQFNNQTEYYNIVFDAIEDYVFVCAFEKS